MEFLVLSFILLRKMDQNCLWPLQMKWCSFRTKRESLICSLSTSANYRRAPGVMWPCPQETSYSLYIPEAERMCAIPLKSTKYRNSVWKSSLPFHHRAEFLWCVDWTHCPILLSFDGKAKTQIYHGSINNPQACQVAINTARSCHLTQSQSA